MLRASKPAESKVQIAQEIEDLMKDAKSILLSDFKGLSVAKFDDLRKRCFENQIIFRVAKNRLVKIVLSKLGYTGLDEVLVGTTGFCMGYDDPITPIRLLSEFNKEHKLPVLKGCILEGKLYGEEKIAELKSIPPRETLLGMVVGGIASPLSGFVFLLNEILRSFVGVVDSLSQKYESEGIEKEGFKATGGSVEKIIESIEKMTVLELVELKKALEDKFGVTAATPIAAAGAVAAVEAVEEEDQTEFDVILTAIGDKKIQVIKEVRALTSLGLKEAKALVDEHPKAIKEGISKDEAMAVKAKIEDAGGQVEIK